MTRKIVFMGTPEFSVKILDSLHRSEYEVVYVYTQPPKKSNRGMKTNISPIHSYAKKNNLNIRHPITLNSVEEFNFFKTINAEIIIVVAYGQIIPKKYLDIPKYGFINIHASLLPKWRGAAPIQRAIMNLDKEIGISFMKITNDLDAGPVMKTFKIDIIENESSIDVSNKLSELSANKIINVINEIFNNKPKFIEQAHSLATYAKKIKKEEGKIDWNRNSREIIAIINGLNPSPGAWFVFKNQRYKVWKAESVDKKGSPGEILNNEFVIACKDKAIKFNQIQKEGKKKLFLKEFLLGINFINGEKVS
jgi:methionyl-tRNA formyltransferase